MIVTVECPPVDHEHRKQGIMWARVVHEDGRPYASLFMPMRYCSFPDGIWKGVAHEVKRVLGRRADAEDTDK